MVSSVHRVVIPIAVQPAALSEFVISLFGFAFVTLQHVS